MALVGATDVIDSKPTKIVLIFIIDIDIYHDRCTFLC